MKLSAKQKKQMLFVGAVSGILLVTSVASDSITAREELTQGILRGRLSSEVYEGTFVAELGEGTRQAVDITVYPRELSEDEKQQLIKRAVEEFEQQYLGDNESSMTVSEPLIFSESFCEGMVQAQYDTDTPNLLWADGTVVMEALTGEGQLVSVDVTFTCQESQLIYSFSVQIVLPEITDIEEQQLKFFQGVKQAEEASRQDERFVLPKEIEGKAIDWKKKTDTQPFVFVLLGVAAMICIWKKAEEDEKKQKAGREKKLLMEYPQMVSQLSLLMGAGMSLFTAWERMVKRYLQRQVKEIDCVSGPRKCREKQQTLYLEEMLAAYRDIKDGGNIRRAYREFGNRIGLAPYRKVIALLLQNLDKGNKDLVGLLDMEAELVLEEQKNLIRRQGEEAGTKLLFPMMLMFVMILIVIMVPAILSF